MKHSITLNVADYTDLPIGRNTNDGPINGADFRDNYLIPALDEYEFVTVDFNKVLGTAPSFLDEVFGGIIRNGYIDANELKRRVKISYRLDSVIQVANKFMNEAQATINKSK